MKIIFVLPDMPGGGSEKVVSLLANEYVTRGYEVDILLFAGNTVAYSLDHRVKVHSIGEESKGSIKIRIQRLQKMREYYKQNKGSYIFSFSVMGAVFSVIATIGLGVKMLVSERNDPSKYQHQWIRNLAYRRAGNIVCQTSDMVKLFPVKMQSKMTVIPNPVNPEELPEFHGKRKKWISAVGRLEEQKNQKLLIQAFADFSLLFEEYTLHIYGEGQLLGELQELARKLGVYDKVFFHGFSKTVKEEIVDSSMFVLSSDYEGISNSMIEAIAMGIPVVSTDCPVGGGKEYIVSGESGILVPIRDKKALCDAMKLVAGDEKLANKLSENGKKVKEIYALPNIADRFLEVAMLPKKWSEND